MFWANVPACRSLYIGLICTVVILWGAVTSWFCCPCCPGAKYIEEKQARCPISFRMSEFLIILGDWVGCPAGNRKMSRIGRTAQCCPFCSSLCFLCDILSSHPVLNFHPGTAFTRLRARGGRGSRGWRGSWAGSSSGPASARPCVGQASHEHEQSWTLYNKWKWMWMCWLWKFCQLSINHGLNK